MRFILHNWQVRRNKADSCHTIAGVKSLREYVLSASPLWQTQSQLSPVAVSPCGSHQGLQGCAISYSQERVRSSTSSMRSSHSLQSDWTCSTLNQKQLRDLHNIQFAQQRDTLREDEESGQPPQSHGNEAWKPKENHPSVRKEEGRMK